MGEFLSRRERRALVAFARTVVPGGAVVPEADDRVVAQLERLVDEGGPPARRGLRALAWALELRAVGTTGRRFSSLDAEGRERVLRSMRSHRAEAPVLRVGLIAVRTAYANDPAIWAMLGCERPVPAAADEPARWKQGLLDARDLDPGEELACDVVIVGSGAGGAALAEGLAARGHAVLMVEEGGYFSRPDFDGQAVPLLRKLYRDQAATFALGNAFIPIPLGQTVGGTTTVNSGTCFRLPERTMAEWRDRHGLAWVTAEALDPYYREVEAMLQVAPAAMEHVGMTGEVIARGCEALGYSHHVLLRNAPDCDGQGLCCFGCPTDAKRSTNVSYVPAALERSAFVLHGVRVDRVLTRGGAARGVSGTVLLDDGTRRRVEVRAPVVVLACGSIGTPALLLANELANGSREVGCNLSIHPAGYADARFDEVIDGHRSIPQGYCIDHFAGEGLMFEGGTTPIEIPTTDLDAFGAPVVAHLERHRHIANFGFMVKDSSRGRVRPGPGGRPVVTYWLNERDRLLCRRGMAIMARVYFAGGAREVYPGVKGWPALTRAGEVDALEAADIAARDFDLSAYHPLGTCRMGVDPRRSVVGPTHETHDVRSLFVCDGSSVPGSMGVNPQLTIMAMARRAVEHVSRRVEEDGGAG